MWRYYALILALMLLPLAACQPPAEPPADPVQSPPPVEEQAADPTAEPTIALEQRELVPGVALPIPGTILPPATEDPNAGMIFDRIYFERTGGPSGGRLALEILGDGTVSRNGVPSTITDDQVRQLSDILDQLGFFGLQGVFTAPGTAPEVLRYSLTVDRADGASRTIDAQEGLLPPLMAALFTLLGDIGAG